MLSHEHVDSLADDDLLRNIVQGCTDCFALLFHRYCRQVFSVSFRIIRDKAETEDILQEVFLSIYLQQERYDASHVETGIATLAIKQRRVIELVHFDGYTLQEASEILRESLANTRNLYYRGLKELREFLSGKEALKNVQETVILERRKDAFRFES